MWIPHQINPCQFQIEKFKIDTMNFGVESLIKFSKPKLFLVNCWLEFVVESKNPYVLSKRCFLMECQLFGQFLPKSNGPKILFSRVVLYSDFPMPTTEFFQLIPIFYVISFSEKPYRKHFCESSLFSEFPFYSKSSLCSSPFNGSFQSSKRFSQISVRFELVNVCQNGIWFKLINVDK